MLISVNRLPCPRTATHSLSEIPATATLLPRLAAYGCSPAMLLARGSRAIFSSEPASSETWSYKAHPSRFLQTVTPQSWGDPATHFSRARPGCSPARKTAFGASRGLSWWELEVLVRSAWVVQSRSQVTGTPPLLVDPSTTGGWARRGYSPGAAGSGPSKAPS